MRGILADAPHKFSHKTLTAEEAAIRAAVVLEDMAAVGFELRLSSFPVPLKNGTTIHVPIYECPESDFGKDGVHPKTGQPYHDTQTAGGSGLTHGDLIRLSKACMIGRKYLPGKWPVEWKTDLHGNRHLPCIQELLWLARFKCPSNILHSVKVFRGSKKDVDWRFERQGQILNVEVKYRPADWTKFVDGAKFSPSRLCDFHDVAGKFPSKNPGELNVLAITTVAPIDDSLRTACEELMKITPALDAILIWSEHPGDGPTTMVFPEDAVFVDSFFNHGDEEDRRYIASIRYVLRNSEERRSLTTEEGIQWIVDKAKNDASFPTSPN